MTKLQQTIRNSLLAIFIALAPGLAMAQEAGTAASVRGYVTAMDAEGDIRQLARGDLVYSGDTLTTGDRSRVRVVYTDGSVTVLTANSVLVINEYVFNGQEDGTEVADFSFIQGGLEAISGVIGETNKEAFRLETPLATIGLRGTVYKVEILNDQNGNRFLNLSVLDGSVIYSSPGLPSVPVATGQSVSQQSGQQPQSQQGIITTEFSVTADGEDQAEDWLDVLFNTDVITEEDKEAALDAIQGVEADNTPPVQDTSSDDTQEESSSLPEVENIPDLVQDPNVELDPDAPLPPVFNSECPTGQLLVVSPGAPNGTACIPF